MRKGLIQIQNRYQFLDEEYNTNEFSKLFQKHENDLTLNENANIFYMITDSMWVINDLKLNINFDSLNYIISYYTLYIKPLNTIKNQEKLHVLVLLLELCITLDIQKSKELCLLFYEDISNRNCEFNLCLNDIYKEIRKKFKFKDYAFVKDTLSELTHVFKNRIYIYRTNLFNWLLLMKYSNFKSNKTFYFHLENIGRIYNDFRFTKSDIKDLEKWNVTPEQLKQTIHKMITEDVDLCKILNQKKGGFNCSCNAYYDIHHIKKNPYLFILITSLKYNLDLSSLSQYCFNEKTGFIKNDSFFKYFCDNEKEIKENLLNYDLQTEADRVIKEFFKTVNIKDIYYFNSHVSAMSLRIEEETRKLAQFYTSNSYGAPLIYISTTEIENSKINILDVYFDKNNEPTADYLEKNGTKEELMYINNQFYFKRSFQKNKYSNYRPLNLKDIKDNKILLEFVKIYLNYLYNNKIYFAKDILIALEQSPMYLPVPLSELLTYKNWAHFFNEKYQGKNILKKYNFNKHNPNYNYILLKSCKNLTNDGINCLQQSKELPLNDIERIFKETDNTGKIKTFLYYIISRHFKEPIDDDCEISDSIYMAFYLKQKIPLNRLKTNSSVRKYHDKLTQDFIMKKIKSRKYALKIKKDSKFNDLRKILPPEFEWIKNKKRLIQETVIQHHCVATYNELINKDICTIYSTIYKGKRYTMEFRKKKKKFYLHQVQGKYNVENTAEIRKYIEDILIDYYSIHSSSSNSSSNLPK